ncbi:hypothetical protein [Soonwooa sp.]|uniref:hypothetical protein n=1 Tax=Soonwooa sp. TaxID=1938592 RepID=UPI0028A7F64B|nr:hypothetical protein [Soonwooa sp.]
MPSAKNAWYTYIFSYYARGMNFTDIAELEWSQIENNHFKYIRNKTDVLIKIQLPDNKIIQEILAFYKMYRPFNESNSQHLSTQDIIGISCVISQRY